MKQTDKKWEQMDQGDIQDLLKKWKYESMEEVFEKSPRGTTDYSGEMYVAVVDADEEPGHIEEIYFVYHILEVKKSQKLTVLAGRGDFCEDDSIFMRLDKGNDKYEYYRTHSGTYPIYFPWKDKEFNNDLPEDDVKRIKDETGIDLKECVILCTL